MIQSSVHEQLENEASDWKRMLAFFREENIHFKNQLIEILAGETDRELLDAAEFFQDAFLAQDQVLLFLSGELSQYCRLLAGTKENSDDLSEVKKSRERLRNDIEKESEIYKKLQSEFALYLTEKYSRIIPDEDNMP